VTTPYGSQALNLNVTDPLGQVSKLAEAPAEVKLVALQRQVDVLVILAGWDPLQHLERRGDQLLFLDIRGDCPDAMPAVL
jgi:hypothetical protein